MNKKKKRAIRDSRSVQDHGSIRLEQAQRTKAFVDMKNLIEERATWKGNLIMQLGAL